ncbi:bifunctional ligase/repressor BirA [Pullulanibacillus camelliae]|uniref:Bifunctional ligase/repressor BirA n=1 Tax=Pullulanibacillus camelliae TaxID=1707096 RepID=A0A8J2VMP0_9BACL|nr:biotin--[acetyl-CoA-carboxylase] ligase [Pullulanibacillus camelliae]GGE39000.1 bifunctional ligase/repressor BirA [Pullulanibacillus camelliae]
MSRTKEETLKILLRHQQHYISGQALCEQLGCSRTAIWKQINELRKEGYTIDSVQKKGYKLLAKPNKLIKEEIDLHLTTDTFGRHLIYYEEVPSTQKLAHHLAEDGAAEGTLVVADEQTDGRGRLGRAWHSPKGTGIWMSCILRPTLSLERIPQLTLIAAVSIVRAIKKISGVQCGIKWPNDILFNGKKLVGILTELQAEIESVRAVIIGMGINVNVDADAIPEALKPIATSLKMISGVRQSREQLIAAIMSEFEGLYHMYLEEGFSIIKQMWEAHALNIGQHIHARLANGDVIHGIAQGINDKGVLLLQDDQGETHHIYSADINL